MTLVPVTKKNFADKSFYRPKTYKHALGDLVTKIAPQEIQNVAERMVISFIKKDEKFHLIALLGTSTEHKNAYVTKKGDWIGSYVPARYRAHPFGLGLFENNMLLCVDDESPLIQNDSEGIRFFKDDGSKTPFFDDMAKFLGNLHNGILAADAICAALDSLECIVPWDVKIVKASTEVNSEGLYQIDEEKLGRLDGQSLEKLRDIGALQVSYMQLFSRVHTRILGRLQAFHERAGAALSELGSQIFDPAEDHGFNFDID